MPATSNQPDQPTGRVRAGRAQGGRFTALVVAVGAILLLAIAVVGNLEPASPKSPSAPPTISPAPTQIVASRADRLYVFSRAVGPDRHAAGAIYTVGQPTPIFALDGASDGALALDGARLFVRFSDDIAAIDTRSGDQIWRYAGGAAGPANDGALALSVDQRTLAWYRNDWAGGASITWLDADSGQAQQSTAVKNGPLEPARLALAANGTAYLFSSSQILAIDRTTGAATEVRAAAPGQLAAALSPDGAVICVLENGATLLLIDALSQRVIRQFPLDAPGAQLPQWPQQLAFSPQGGRLAIAGARLGQFYASAGRLNRPLAGTQTLIVDLADGTIVASHHEERTVSGVAAYAGYGSALYLTALGGIARWEPAARDNSASQPIAEAGSLISAILVGPPVEWRRSSAAPDRTPAAPSLVRLQADRTPLAWIWLDRTQVLEFAADGTRRVIAERVIQVIPRLPDPPLLLTAPEVGRWAIFDPLTGSTTALSMTAPPERANPGPGAGFILSPDGAALTFLTTIDPIPGDAYERPQQLVRADLRSGAVVALLDPTIFGALLNVVIERWEPDGIYLRTTIRDPGTSIAQWIWRFDPDTPGATPKALLVALGGEPNVVIDGRAGLIVDQPYPRDIERSELRLHSIADGSEKVIYVGGFIDQDSMLIAPDGQALAYLRPLGRSSTVELMLYDLPTGTTSVIAGGLRGARLQSIDGGRALAFRSPTDPWGDGPRRHQIFGWRDGGLLTEALSTPPGAVIADRLSEGGGRLAEVIYADRQPLLRVSELGPHPAVAAVMPTFMLPTEELADDYIIYLP